MTWIKTIPYKDADGRLKKLYDRIKGPEDNSIENIMSAHSLRPHTMEGHIVLFKNVMHHPGNKIEKWFLELMGLYVSILNQCQYCIEHHYAGMAYLLDDEPRARLLSSALETGDWQQAFDPKQIVALRYIRTLTTRPSDINETSIHHLRQTGWSDGEILEINQVAAYFAYANRMVLGLGTSTAGETHDYDKWRKLGGIAW